MDVDETIQSKEDIPKVESEAAETSAAESATIGRQVIRMANPATSATADGVPYREDKDPRNPKKFNIENIIVSQSTKIRLADYGQD